MLRFTIPNKSRFGNALVKNYKSATKQRLQSSPHLIPPPPSSIRAIPRRVRGPTVRSPNSTLPNLPSSELGRRSVCGSRISATSYFIATTWVTPRAGASAKCHLRTFQIAEQLGARSGAFGVLLNWLQIQCHVERQIFMMKFSETSLMLYVSDALSRYVSRNLIKVKKSSNYDKIKIYYILEQAATEKDRTNIFICK